jgi:hypothetical protein
MDIGQTKRGELQVGGFSPDMTVVDRKHVGPEGPTYKKSFKPAAARRACPACCGRGGCRKSIPGWPWGMMVAIWAKGVKFGEFKASVCGYLFTVEICYKVYSPNSTL